MTYRMRAGTAGRAGASRPARVRPSTTAAKGRAGRPRAWRYDIGRACRASACARCRCRRPRGSRRGDAQANAIGDRQRRLMRGRRIWRVDQQADPGPRPAHNWPSAGPGDRRPRISAPRRPIPTARSARLGARHRPGAPTMQHRGHSAPPCRDIGRRSARRARRASARSGGWHGSRALVVPTNITFMPLPPKCPELNPVENVWQFMRDSWLSNRIFKSCDDILAASPGTIPPISHGGSCHSDCGHGRMDPDQRVLV